MTSGDIAASTRSGVVWSTLAFLGTKVLSIASIAVLARLLTPDDFGVVAAIVVFVGFVELGGDLGMRSTVVYEQEEGISHRVQTAFTINVALILTLTTIGILAAGPVSAFFGLEDDVWLFRLACLAMPLRAFGNIADSLLLRELAFKKRILPELANSTVKAGVSIGLAAFAGWTVSAMVAGILAGNLVWSATQWRLTGFRPTFAFDRTVARSMVSYGGMAAVLDIVAALSNRLDAIVIGRLLGERALGLYNVASRVPELAIDSVSWTVSRVAFPALSRTRRDSPLSVGEVALGLVRYQALYALPVAAGAAVLAEPLLVVMFGEVWGQGAGVLAALAVMAAARAVSFPVGDVFKAMGRQGVLVLLNVVQLPLFLAALLVVGYEGITAVAWLRAGVTVAFSLTLALAARRVADIHLRDLARASVPAVLAAAGVLAGAGAVRLAIPDGALLPLLAGTAAGGAGGLLMLVVFARGALRDAVALVSRRGSAPETAAG